MHSHLCIFQASRNNRTHIRLPRDAQVMAVLKDSEPPNIKHHAIDKSLLRSNRVLFLNSHASSARVAKLDGALNLGPGGNDSPASSTPSSTAVPSTPSSRKPPGPSPGSERARAERESAQETQKEAMKRRDMREREARRGEEKRAAPRALGGRPRYIRLAETLLVLTTATGRCPLALGW